MTTTYAPGVVTVTAPGHYRLSELRDEAALRFAEELQRPVDWPTLAGTGETVDGMHRATYVLEGATR